MDSLDNTGMQFCFNLWHLCVLVCIGIPLTEDESTTYESNMTLLAEEHSKEKPSLGKIKRLMKETFIGRRNWIMGDMPQVHRVLELFPVLKTSDRVRMTFSKIKIISFPL